MTRIDPCGLTLADFFDQWYRPRRMPAGSPRTVILYELSFRHFRRFLQREPLVSDLNEKAMADFMQWLNTTTWYGRPRKPRTCNSVLDRLMALATYATKKRLLDEVPDILPFPEPQHIPDAYTCEEIARLLDACDRIPRMICGLPPGPYWRAMLLVFYDTGLRSGPVWSMKQADVDLAKGTVFVPAASQKNHQPQQLRLHAETVTALKRIWTPPRELAFPWPYCTGTRYQHFRRILQAAGLPIILDYMHMFHKLRRTTATLMHDRGGDATQQLGHSSDAVTRRHYLAPTSIAQAADILPRPERSKTDDLTSQKVLLRETIYGYKKELTDSGGKAWVQDDASVVRRILLKACGFQVSGDINARTIDEKLRQLQKTGLATATLHKYRLTVRRFLGWLAERQGALPNLMTAVALLDTPLESEPSRPMESLGRFLPRARTPGMLVSRLPQPAAFTKGDGNPPPVAPG